MPGWWGVSAEANQGDVAGGDERNGLFRGHERLLAVLREQLGGDGYRAFAAVAPVLDGYEQRVGSAGSDLLKVEGGIEINGGDGEVVGLLGVWGVTDIGGTLPGRI